MMAHTSSLKFILLSIGAILIGLCIFIGLVFYEDHLEEACYSKTRLLVGENPDQLVEISIQEKEDLGIGNIIPTKRFYEMRKCLKNKN